MEHPATDRNENYVCRINHGKGFLGMHIWVPKIVILLWCVPHAIPRQTKLFRVLRNHSRKSYFLKNLNFIFFLAKYSALERNDASIWWKLLILRCKIEASSPICTRNNNVKSRILTKLRHRYAPKQSTWQGKNKFPDFSKKYFFVNGSEVLENIFSWPGIACVTHQSSITIFGTKIFDMSLLTFCQARDIINFVL